MKSASTAYKHLHTTRIEPEVTASEMMKVLALIRAKSISTDLDTNGDPCGISFVLAMPIPNKPGSDDFEQTIDMMIRVPVRWDAIQANLLKAPFKGSTAKRESRERKLKAQAKRTAWRLALEWLQVNAVFIQLKTRHPAEVFLADMIVNKAGDTFGAHVLTGKNSVLNLTHEK